MLTLTENCLNIFKKNFEMQSKIIKSLIHTKCITKRIWIIIREYDQVEIEMRKNANVAYKTSIRFSNATP